MVALARKTLGVLLAALMVAATIVAIPGVSPAKAAGEEYFSISHSNTNVTVGNSEYYAKKLQDLGLGSSDASEITENLADDSTELLVLQAGLVQNVGYDTLKKVANSSEKAKETLVWLLTDLDALRDYVTGGKPTHSDYTKSLEVLTELYTGSKTITCNDTTGYAACGGDKTTEKLTTSRMT